MTDDQLRLAAEFPPPTREQWLKLVEGVLKGAPFDQKLVATTYDALRVEPLYARRADAQPLAARVGAWRVMQRVDHPDPAAAHAEALHELENGATGLSLVLAGATGAYGFGLPATKAGLSRVLKDIRLDGGIAVELDLAAQAKDAPAHLAALVKERGLPPDRVALRFGFNPLGALARTGASSPGWPDIAPRFASAIAQLAADGFRGPFAAADGRVIHNAGGSEAQELAFVLAVALAYLRALEEGVALDQARRMLFFRLSADADQFLTIAKLRALRKLWARVEEACGLAPAPIHISAETAWRMMTRRDPWVNMLRATMAVFAAGIGGADAISVLPYTAALGLPDRLARRIARNTQLILLEESNLAAVADPAAGSGGIEELTDKLCGTAWSLFQEIEKVGGAWSALEQGLIQRKVAAVRAAREQAVARRKDALTGTSEFPNLDEPPVGVLDVAPVTVAPATPKVTIDPLPAIRLAEPFEKLRDASDRLLAETGARPKIFLANLGKLADVTARATFAKNFFEAGGIAAVTNDGFAAQANGAEAADVAPATDLTALLAAFRASGAALACLCSSDRVYAAEAPAAAQALADAGARHIYLAGRPGEHAPALRAAGVGTFVHAGCDALATLRAAHDILAEHRP